jgi:phage-related protein
MSRSFAPLIPRRAAKPAPAKPAPRPAAAHSRGAPAGTPRLLARPAPPVAASKPALSQRGDRWEAEARGVAEAATRAAPKPNAAGRPALRVVAMNPARSSGGGQPISSAIRPQIEATLGADVSAVRVHTGPNSERLAARVNARAYTTGSDIHLGAGASPLDLRLIAHEAAHALQQSAELNAAYPQGPPQQGRGLYLSRAPPGMIQRDEAEPGVFSFWGAVERFAPRWAVELLREVRSVGFLGFLKKKITGALNGIFAALKNSGGVTGYLANHFGQLVAKARVILSALASGNCGPLFEALGQLRDTLSQMAGEAWDKITEFLRPVGEWLSGVWEKFGAPVVDFLKEFAGDVWDFIKDLGNRLWEATKPVRDWYSGAWTSLKELLGFGDSSDDDGSSGLIGWIKEQAGIVWNEIKVTFQPIIEPIKRVAAKVTSWLPLDAIRRLRDKVNGWLESATQMADSMDGPGDVAENQDLLRDIVLPGIRRAIADLRASVAAAGEWVTGGITELAAGAGNFVGMIEANEYLSPFSGAIGWVRTAADELAAWVNEKVHALFGLIDQGMEKLSTWVEPVLKFLKKVFDTLSDLAGRLPDLILGPFMLVPKCIRDPIKDFLITQILSRIPIFSQILALPDIWKKIQSTFRIIIVQVFRDGNLAKAAWTFFKSILEVVGIPPKLITDLIRNAAKAIGDILKDPVGFLINLGKALGQGLKQFFSNIGTHLLSGLADWMFGHIAKTGIKIPQPFSFAGVFDIVLQVLDITKERILSRLEKKLTKEQMAVVRKMMAVGEAAFKWVKILIERGPMGVWEEIKAKLSNLWQTLLDAVLGWLEERVVKAALKWLVSFLDVTGIMPVVRTILAIQSAIETVAQYINQLLEIVNSVCLGISDIAKGAIGTAANLVERTAARLVPFGIAMLASVLGLGSIGDHMRKVVDGIRKKVDEGIDWLIDKAKAAVEAVTKAVGKIVAAVMKWWKAEEPIPSTDGQEHRIYLDGNEDSASLRVASSPMDAQAAIDLMTDAGATAAQIKKAGDHKKTIEGAVKELVKLNKALNTGATPGNKAVKDDEVSAQNKILRDGMRDLAELLGETVFSQVKYEDLEQTQIAPSSGGKASTIEAAPLSPKRNMGTKPSVSPAGWDAITAEGLTEKDPHYVRLHLINENFQGPGHDVLNLVPGSKQNNGDHLRTAENQLKDIVGVEPGKKAKKVAQVWYKAVVHYRSAGDEKGWKKKYQNQGLKSSDFAQSITFTWGLYLRDVKKKTWEKNTKTVGSFTLGPIPLPDLS